MDGHDIVQELREERPKGHGPGILDDIDRLLKKQGWHISELDGFVAGLGPGSFTGLRICLATLKGFALAFEKPLFGARTTALLRSAVEADSVAVLDARRGQVYVEGGPVIEPVCCAPKEVSDLLGEGPHQLVGDGAILYRDLFLESMPTSSICPDDDLHYPRAGLLARMVNFGEPAQLATLEPVYVRKSDAEINYPDGFPNAAGRIGK